MSNPENIAPANVPVAAGQVLAGKYRVDRVLGVGGMGVVVAATHLQLEQRVALKFMLDAGLKNTPLVERFAREARAAVRLKSDYVARVLDVGTLESGSPYMVMEYLEGQDLGALLEQRGPLPVDAAVDCVLQACDAVAEAHSLGIVHRDLKPRNLFLTTRNDGRPVVKVLDFGISKQTATADLSLTRTTEIIGSPNYMSPEQFRAAKAADGRSDIWALGVILYELLTAHLPFPAESVTQLTAMVLSEPPRPMQALRANVPEELVRIVERCMMKEPAARFQSVGQLAMALQRFASPDARELATRIARIGAARGSISGASGNVHVATAIAPTPVSWTGSTVVATSPRAKVAVITGIVAMASLTLAGGTWFVVARPSQLTHRGEVTGPAASPAMPTAALGAAAPPAPAASQREVLLAPATATTSTTLSPPTAKPPWPAQATHGGGASPHPTHVATEAGAVAPLDDSPRYRTNW
jgi:serine/threonine-protein kinase